MLFWLVVYIVVIEKKYLKLLIFLIILSQKHKKET